METTRGQEKEDGVPACAASACLCVSARRQVAAGRRAVIGFRDGVDGAEERLQAARVLQDKLELILRGEPPYDVFVRWKPLHEQPMGWEPERRRLSLLCVLCVSVVKTAREAARCKERT